MKSKQIPITSLLEILPKLNQNEEFVLLYSGKKNLDSGHHSYLALFPMHTVQSNSFNYFRKFLEAKLDKYAKKDSLLSAWFGYIAYDIKDEIEHMNLNEQTIYGYKKIHFKRFRSILRFDHNTLRCDIFYLNSKDYQQFCKILKRKKLERIPSKLDIQHIRSNFTRKSYLEAVERIRQYIRNGDIYEANLTRKFFTQVNHFEALSCFLDLQEQFPSHYSALINFRSVKVISSSPERFLTVKKKEVSSKPIKGTERRGRTNEEDLILKERLQMSEKNKSENLMIVDLVRNDLSRVSELGSVKVDKLFEVETYSNIFQMVSSIRSKLLKSQTIFDLIAASFPPGSMTGAPKIRAMEICAELEKLQRGIYSGALGYISSLNDMDLSVIIRSVIVHKGKLEFQAGGAIVYDSDPQSEENELYQKLASILQVLQINTEMLRNKF